MTCALTEDIKQPLTPPPPPPPPPRRVLCESLRTVSAIGSYEPNIL